MVDDAARTWAASMPQSYERWLVPTVFRPFAVDLAARVAALAPRLVLELAAGTGVVTAELVARGLDVVATDLNPPMVELGRSQVPGASWQQADATALPFDDGSYDAVVCQFGVMFLPDKPAAFAEARRVLTPGGTLLFSTWGTVDQNHYAAALVAALVRVLPADPPTFVAAVPHGYADPDTVVHDVGAGGFSDVALETLTLVGNADSAADVARGFCTGTPLRPQLEARGDLRALTEQVAAEVERELGSGPVTGPMTAHVVRARR